MIEVLQKDFLDRDQDSFVKIRRTGRLGWESLIPSGGNYSDILRDCCGDGDVVCLPASSTTMLSRRDRR